MFHPLFEASRPLQHNKAPKPGDRGRDTEDLALHPHSFPFYSLFSYYLLLFQSFSLSLYFSPPSRLPRCIYSPPLYNSFLFCFSMYDAGSSSLFLPPCLLREKSASYGFYSLVVPPPRIPLSSPPNQPLFPFLHLGFFSIPYASPFHYPPFFSQIVRLMLHGVKTAKFL